MRLLFVEQSLGVFREFENPDAFFKVGLVGDRVALDVPQASVLLYALLRRHLVEELGVNAPVQFVHIHCVDALKTSRRKQ